MSPSARGGRGPGGSRSWMTVQEPFHYFARRAGGLALLSIHLAALVHHRDFLAEIRVMPGQDDRLRDVWRWLHPRLERRFHLLQRA